MTWDLVLRLILAALYGSLIGLDREYRAKEAGIRTHFLVCLGSALFMIVSQYGFEDFANQESSRFAPLRIAAPVASALGCIGAGTIIIQKQFVRGLTTAAGMWSTAAIGLVVGAGMYWIGLAGVLLTLIGLELTNIVLKTTNHILSTVSFSTSRKENLKEVTDYITKNKFTLINFVTEEKYSGDQLIYHVTFNLLTKRNKNFVNLLQFMHSLPDITIKKME
ncbi:MAG: MgtC/SapB family protein [Odoribacter sp.]|nr:MgtC/SapB family protein [Odoribacter sp.]